MVPKVVSAVLSFVFCLLPATVSAQAPQAAEPAFRVKEHAKLYHYHTGKNIPQLAATGSGDITIAAGPGPGVWGVSGKPRPAYPHPFLVDQAYWSDLVTVVTVRDCSSALTEDQDFLFTDCEATIEQVLKDNPLAPLKAGAEIVVTRAGGTLVLNGRTVRAKAIAFRSFHPGGRYVLFLSYIAATGAYRAYSDRSFELLERGVNILTGGAGWLDMKSRQDPDRFLSETRAAVAAATEFPARKQ